MKVSDYIAEFLLENGVSTVFGYPGGAVTHLVDSFYRNPGIRWVGTYHEQAAAFAAEGYARLRNGLGAAVATSGPGATNLITGIGSAYFDSVPVLYLTGQVNTYEYKGELRVRQLGFQETDIVGIVKPIVKYAVRVTDPHDIRYELEKAVATALGGRKGPVLVDLPMDVQRAEIEPDELPGYRAADPDRSVSVEPVLRMLRESRRPMLLVGGGVRLSGAEQLLGEIAEKLRIPVVCSLMGRDAYDNSAENYIGMIGSYGSRGANFTAANSDLILAVGTRLDTRQTGTVPESFARDAKLIRVDADPAELAHKIHSDEIGILSDGKPFLEKLRQNLGSIPPVSSEWLSRAQKYRDSYPPYAEKSLSDPNYLLAELSGCMGRGDTVCLDIGQNQMWAAQSLRLTDGRRLLTSGGMGPMGFALPCAEGVCYAGGEGDVYAVAGDGGMQMNLQELELVKRENLPVKIIVLNNRSLGMIRHFQEMYFEGRTGGTVEGYAAPDFCKIAAAFGIPSMRLEQGGDFGQAKEFLASPGPLLLEVLLPQKTYVFPKLGVNHPVEEQEPPLSPEEFRKNMIVKPYEPNELRFAEEKKGPDGYRAFIKRIFDSFKCRQKGDLLRCIPILDADGATVGMLRPITVDFRASIPGCAAVLARWRNENPSLSAEPFTATEPGTEKWLDSLVIGRDDRLLFLILSNSGQKIGHIGFSTFSYEERSCEVDAVLRGDKNALPGMMGFAMHALLEWGKRNLWLKTIRLRVFEDNGHAIRFYERNGFVAEKTLRPDETGKTYKVMRLAETEPESR